MAEVALDLIRFGNGITNLIVLAATEVPAANTPPRFCKDTHGCPSQRTSWTCGSSDKKLVRHVDVLHQRQKQRGPAGFFRRMVEAEVVEEQASGTLEVVVLDREHLASAGRPLAAVR